MKKVCIVRLTDVVDSFRGIGQIVTGGYDGNLLESCVQNPVIDQFLEFQSRLFHSFCATVSIFMPIFLLSLLTVVCFCQYALGEDFPRPESLFTAIEKGDYDAVQRLIHAKVNVNDRGNRDESPLHFAVDKGDAKMVKLLLDAGADTGVRAFVGATFHGGTPLHVAARANHVEIIKLLLQAGTDVNIRNQDDTLGHTPLYCAIDAGRFEAAECLIQAGADVNMGETELGCTPLILAVQEGHLNIIKLLLDNNVNVNLPRNGGLTPLDFAANSGSFEIVSLLVLNPAKPERA